MKKTKIISALVCAAMLICAIPSFAADKPYTKFYQAEDLDLDGESIEVVEDAEAIGGKSLACYITGNDATDEGFTFQFNIEKAGDYMIWGRVYYPGQSNNSIFYSVDDEESKIWDFIDEDEGNSACYNSWQYFYLTDRVLDIYEDEKLYGPWTMDNNEWRHAPNVLSLTKGLHSIHFSGRENGWFLDELIVTELSIDEYDPNACPGNNNFAECKFCGTNWKHYCKDIYSLTGQTAEDYYNTVLYPDAAPVEEAPAEEPAAETVEAPAAAEAPAEPEVVEAPVATAPQTFDFGVIAAVAAVISAAGYAISKKK